MSLNITTNITSFVEEITKLTTTHNLDIMDAVVHFCEKTGMEIETAASIIKKHEGLKSLLQEQAETLNFMPKRARLPL